MADREREADAETVHKNHAVYFVPGLHRGLRVLEVLAAAERPLSLSEIASELDLTRSSVFRLVYTLRHMGFLEEDGKLVSLGPRVLNIGFAFLASKDIVEIARPELETLRDETSISAHLAIRDGRDVLYLGCVQTRSGFLSNMNVGSRVPAYASPMGWLLLAGLDDGAIRDLVRRDPLKKLTDLTPSSARELVQLVAEVRARGYVVSRGMMEAGGSSIAVPVINRHGGVVAAIDLSGPDTAFDLDQMEGRYLDALRTTARRIGAHLG